MCMREPLTPFVTQYVQYRDADCDVRIIIKDLNGLFLADTFRMLKVAPALLKKGIGAGPTLFDIGLLL